MIRGEYGSGDHSTRGKRAAALPAAPRWSSVGSEALAPADGSLIDDELARYLTGARTHRHRPKEIAARRNKRQAAATEQLSDVVEPVGRNQCDAVSPVIDDRVLEPIVREICVVANDDLQLTVKREYDISHKSELSPHCLPVCVVVFRGVNNFLRKNACVGWSNMTNRGTGRPWVTNQWWSAR